jgi:pyruvate/2-oxoacid:ferredoxin oxidoreductase beta subunit
VKISKLAVQTRLFPLFEVEDGTKIRINKDPKPKDLKTFIELQGRFRHLTEDDVDKLRQDVENRWKRFRRMAESFQAQ